MTFRSQAMKKYQMVIPRDSVYHTFNLIGYQSAIHLVYSGDNHDRSFSKMIKRCEDCMYKIQLMAIAVRKGQIKIQQYENFDTNFVQELRYGWREQAKILGIEQVMLIDSYEQKIQEEYNRFQNLSERIQKMNQTLKESLEKIACLQVLTSFLGDTNSKLQHQQYYLNNISDLSEVKGVSFMVAAIDYQMEWKISKIIYRISRGYACTKTVSDFRFFGLKKFNKKVMLVIYPSSQIQFLAKRLERLMSTYSAHVYLKQQFDYSFQKSHDQIVNRYNEVSSLVEIGQRQYKQFLQKIAQIKVLETSKIFLMKEKTLYENLNKLERRQQFYIANVYLPTQDIKKVGLLIGRIVPTPTLHEKPLQNAPTAFQTNLYTTVAQEITDTYGVPRYQQINPSIFTTVTFPLFFGVMFGDIAHGAMVLALGIYAVMYSEQLSKSKLKMLARMKFMLVLMGFFAMYCGFIYNDFAGFNMNFFNSCYNPPPHASFGVETQGKRIFPTKGCVYPFGIDPVWGRAENELVFVNSLKMKISVIIAIIHMTLGVCCKAANSIFFKKKLQFYFEFIPQFIFLVGLFGYMDFLIVFKWLKNWDEKVGTIAPQRWAPSIINTMMNIGLGLGKTSQLPDGGSNMWGQRGNTSQDGFQIFLLIISFICIPLMLIPKPYIEIKQKNKIALKKQINPLHDENFEDISEHDLAQKLLLNKDSQIGERQQDSSQIVVHQLIETIQFVLGAISNTASYLRLWALSLAHSQLSKVFFQQTAGTFFGTFLILQIPGLFIGSWMVMWVTFGIILCMDSMQCFLHSLRLHWVQFQNKFYKGDGYPYNPICYQKQILKMKQKQLF